ncbi:LINE-1 retrotransposable element ORF2 protein [Linum perenne]
MKVGNDRIRERLDRALCTTSWRNTFHDAEIIHEQIIGSDHAPLRLILQHFNRRESNRTPFKFDQKWIEEENFEDRIRNGWEKGNDCNTRLKHLTKDLVDWSKSKRHNSAENIRCIQRQLCDIQTAGRDPVSAEIEKALKEELDYQWRQEEIYWKQRAGVRWLKEGDRNTKFFHASTIQRRQKNRILKLRIDDTNWIDNENQIVTHIREFYENLFSARDPVDNGEINTGIPSIITDEINQWLCKEVSEEEIKNAVFQMGANKSPGPDGFPGLFYQKYWDVVKEQLCREVRKFFEMSTMPPGWNDTNVAIIPKIPNPETISQFRPISCCNFRYKVISKIMATRLKNWMPRIVSDLQAAFTKGRAIQDNIVIVHEVIHHFKNRATKLQWDMMVKMDMKKAYDMVEWDCLDGILRKMGFSHTWVTWINECVRTVKFSILVNGNPTDQFTPTRGIRQGDPLSPFLFIILSNALSVLINTKVERGELKGVKLNARCPTLTHVLFADDTILFGEASVTEARAFIDTMTRYGNMTGQVVNHQKSSILFSRKTPEALQVRIREILGFQNVEPFGKYLGVPSEWGRSKKEVFEFLLVRMRNLGQSWKSLMLSPGGKEVLLKAVYQSIPTYIMSCFLLPKKLTNKMDSLLRAFFWGGSMTKRTIHWASKEKLTKAKGEGGLGFKDFRTFNKAMLAKQGWRILTNKGELWTKLLKALYFPHSDFLKANKSRRPSWIWASLCDARDVLNLGARKNLVSGEDINVFTDPWIPSIPGFRLASQGGNDIKAEDWLSNDRREWNLQVISNSCNRMETSAILKIPVGPKNEEDPWVWHFDKRGTFSVKSAYHTLRREETGQSLSYLRNANEKIWKWLWSTQIPPKIKFFLWRATNNALATSKNLWRRNCGDSPICQVCNREEETVIHCLFDCPHASLVWNRLDLRVRRPEEPNQIALWLYGLKDNKVSNKVFPLMAGMWSVWKGRNEKVFRQVIPTTESTIRWTTRLVEEWKSIKNMPTNSSGIRPLDPETILRPPPGDSRHHQIRCDGSFISESVEAGYGVVVTNAHGQVIEGKAGTLFCSSSMVAEAKALMVAVQCAMSYEGPTIIKSDCLNLVSALRDFRIAWPWECAAWMHSMRRDLEENPRISISFIPRRLNGAADWVANSVRRGILSEDWTTCSSLLDLL